MTTPKQWGLDPEAKKIAGANTESSWPWSELSSAALNADDQIRELVARVEDLEMALGEIIKEDHRGKWTGHCARYDHMTCDCHVGIARAALEESES